METKDLMIGDYVRNRYTKDIVYIFEIDDDRNIINNEPDGYCGEKNINIDNIEPIPLTSEILEKNGLESDYGGDYFKEDKHYNLEISVVEDEIWWTVNQNEYGIVRLQYVHDLQHALKLCGIDKEIVL